MSKKKAKGGKENVIIAVDFDGILCVNKFPEIGEPKYRIISYVRQLIDAGHEVILWTVRNGQELKEAVAWCEDYGLHFCAINDQAPSNKAEYAGKYEKESRKVYADIYIDDHNLEYMSIVGGDAIAESYIMRGVREWKVD